MPAWRRGSGQQPHRLARQPPGSSAQRGTPGGSLRRGSRRGWGHLRQSHVSCRRPPALKFRGWRLQAYAWGLARGHVGCCGKAAKACASLVRCWLVLNCVPVEVASLCLDVLRGSSCPHFQRSPRKLQADAWVWRWSQVMRFVCCAGFTVTLVELASLCLVFC